MRQLFIFALALTANAIVAFSMPRDTLGVARDDSSSLSRGVHLDSVVVYGSRNNFGVSSSQMSAVSVGEKHITTTPVFLGERDVLKTLQKFPGVQPGSEGTAGIYVRGGDYDENYITLDGSAIYNAEHMRGYVSAINPDVVGSINFYRGAFPARYGSRLSSVVDVGIKAGDFNRYHGLLSLGCLAGRAQVEGPIWKGHTSFNVAARMSYLNLIAKPVLKEYYDRPEAFQPYSNMNYYDITAKLVHRFNDVSRLTAVVYYGKDIDDEQPTQSDYYDSTLDEDESMGIQRFEEEMHKHSLSTRSWDNLLMSLYYTTYINRNHRMNFNLSYSGYKYRMSVASDYYDKIVDAVRLYSLQQEDYELTSSSGVKDAAFAFDAVLSSLPSHQIRYGMKYAHQRFEPKTTVRKHSYTTMYRKGLNFTGDDSELNPKYYEFTDRVNYVNDDSGNIDNVSLYGEDVFAMSPRLEVNYGIRLNAYFVKDKSYFSAEPRVSLRYMLANDLSAKASYSLMSQGLHRLVSNNLVMPSDIWVPVTQDIPLMKSHMAGIGLDYDFKGFNVSAEAYYKTLDHVIEYRNGASYFINDQHWQEIVAEGTGRNYGVELLVEKKAGRTTGWLSYTWSKALRTFDRAGNEINGGKEFYAATDRRHNLSANVTHSIRLSKALEMNVSASWTYQSGRRGTVPYTIVYGQGMHEYNVGMPVIAYGRMLFYVEDIINLDMEHALDIDFAGLIAEPFPTFKYVNDFKLPDVHHLDVNVNFTLKSKLGESMVDIGCYNVYNRYNISNVYVGYNGNRSVLKGICPFPVMPSITITQKF